MVEFRDIKFGEISAEQEKGECPELLISGLIDENGTIDKIVNGNKYLIYGQKGSGKSAIGARIELEYKSSDKVRPRYCKLNDLDYKLFKQFDTGKESNKSERFSKNWSTILSIAILDTFNKNRSGVSLSPAAKNAIKYLENANVLPSSRISSIITKASKKSLLKIPVGDFGRDSEFHYESHNQLHEQIKSAVLTSACHAKHLIMVDELDEVLSFKSEHYSVLTALLQATAQLNEDLREANVDVKIVLFMRTDMLDKLTYPNKQKIVSGYGEELSWYQEGKSAAESNLMKILNLRASVSSNTNIRDLFSYFKFPQKVDGKEIHKYILDHTRHLPRDLILLMSHIQKQCSSSYISERDITRAVRNYSSEYFYGEIQDNLVGMIEPRDRENLFPLFTYLQSYNILESQLESIAKEHGLKMDFGKVMSALYEVGAIGYIVHHVDGSNQKSRYHFKYRERFMQYLPHNEIIIHLALQHALKVRGCSNSSIIDVGD